MRTLLTTLGIVIGVAAVITMMEIGNGATLAIQRTLTSIGANTLVVIPGAQNVGGINYGIGSMTTLSPKDADAIAKECPAVANVAPIVRARTQIVYGNRNWVPTYIYGSTPSFLQVRDWTDMDEGEAFTEHDVRNASKVCIVGKTIVRELFAGQSPIGKEIRVRNVAFKVVGVLEQKGANMMGQDQDDILLAPWTTIKYRVVATSLSGGNQSTTNTSNSTEVNSLSMIYPNISTSLYPTQSTNEAADVPQPIRFANVDQILTNARAARGISPRHRADHRRGPGEPPPPAYCAERFHRPRHDGDHEGHELDDGAYHEAAPVRGHDLPHGRRRRHHEHHARLRHGEDAGDRPAHGGGRRAERYPPPVPHRGR